MIVGIEHIKPLIDEQFIYEGDLTTETLVVDDLGADSFDIPILMNALEDSFLVTIASEEIMNIRTLGDLITIIQNYLNNKEG